MRVKISRQEFFFRDEEFSQILVHSSISPVKYWFSHVAVQSSNSSVK